MSYKDSLIAKVVHRKELGEITEDDALKLSEMIKLVHTSDLKKFIESGDAVSVDAKDSMVNSGIFRKYEAQGSGGGGLYRGMYGGRSGGTRYKITEEGQRLYNIINNIIE